VASAPHESIRFLRRPWILNRIAIAFAVVFSVRYFVWRVTETMGPAEPWLAWPFLGAELIGFGGALLLYLTAWRLGRRRSPPATPGRGVDVFITTRDEPPAQVRDTAVCAVSMRYPHTTWILDAGKRPEIAELSRELGCRYLSDGEAATATRADVLNAGLASSQGEFVATLHADQVPTPDMLERLVGFFEDGDVALVQANRDFYNFDSFQHATDWEDRAAWHDQEFFFNVIQPGRDAFGAAVFCGSPAMLRRNALVEIGGFARETVTEDLHTGLQLQKLGWKVIYSARTAARGLAPRTFDAYDAEWYRWGLGATQVRRLERPLLRQGLTFGQRLCYLASFYFPFSAAQRLFYLLLPLMIVALGRLPLVAEPRAYFEHFVPYLLLNLVATAGLHGSLASFVLTERYSLIKLGAMLRARLDVLLGRTAVPALVASTRPSGAPAGGRRMAPYLALEALLALAVIGGMVRLVAAGAMLEFWGFAVVVLFALYFLYLFVPVVVLAMRRHEFRTVYRFPQRLDLAVDYRLAGADDSAWSETYARNLNRFGVSITLDVALPPETELELVLRLPDRQVRARGTVRWNRGVGSRPLTRHANGVRFETIAPDDQDAIARHLFWEVAPRHGELLATTPRNHLVVAEA